jgi:aspartyl/glutamyl-tRNA(Asn/Gln) amidotransferase C subunit
MSLVSIDEKMVKKLENVIEIANRMNEINTEDVLPLIHFDHTGYCPLREDTEKLYQQEYETILKLSKNTYEEYYKV